MNRETVAQGQPSPHNRIQRREIPRCFHAPGLSFSVSSRMIRPDIDIVDYLRVYYVYCDPRQIESVFGSTTRFSRLYGGRPAQRQYDLTELQLLRLEEKGIGLALTLTNHFFDEVAYRESVGLLERHHRQGNSVICTNDDLARRLKRDFPLYEIKASIIKKLDTRDSIGRALELYDSVTLPMDRNDDDDFLAGLPEKSRLVLFGNANCAYTCPARTCYRGFSEEIFGMPVTQACSRHTVPRLDLGETYFDVRKFRDMGFNRIKLVPLGGKEPQRAGQALSRGKGYPLSAIRQRKPVHYLCSYQKCGRTWLRFILANYLNLYYNLSLEIDLHSCFSLLPNDDCQAPKGFGTYRFLSDTRFPLLLASHGEYTPGRFDHHSAFVYLFRSIPDTVVSDYFHRARFMKTNKESLADFLQRPEHGLVEYCRHLNSWAPRVLEGKALPISYEILHRNPERALASVLAHLGIPLKTDLLRQALDASSFSAMQELERRSGMPAHGPVDNDPEGRRIRKGKVGGSSDYLSPDQIEDLKAAAEALLSPAARELLARSGLFPFS